MKGVKTREKNIHTHTHTSNTVLMAKMKLLYTDAWIRCQCFCHCGVVKKLLNMFYNLEMIFVFFFIYFCKCQWQMHAHTHTRTHFVLWYGDVFSVVVDVVCEWAIGFGYYLGAFKMHIQHAHAHATTSSQR